MQRRHLVMGGFAAMAVSLLKSPAVAQTRTQIREIQNVLAEIGLEPGPADGAMGPKTRAALERFLDHRGVDFDGTVSNEIWREVIGITRVDLPDTPGLRMQMGQPRFTSADSYSRDPNDPRVFTLRLRKGDYDPVDYRGNRNIFSSGAMVNLGKQRAELSSQRLRLSQAYTIEFDVLVSSPTAGTFFQFKASEPAMVLLSYPDAIRFNAGQSVQNVALLRGDWIGNWHHFKIGFYPDGGRGTWVQFIVDDNEVFDSRGRDLDFPFDYAFLKCGLYRGKVTTPAAVTFRNLSLRNGAPS